MAGNRVETTIAYRLDARGLRDARRELEKAFTPENVKATNAALKDAKARVKDLASEYGRAAKAQGAMAEAPKALRNAMKAARDEVQKLTGDMQKQADAAEKLNKLAKESRGTAFRQGLYQGFGGPVSSYMHRRAEATTPEARAELASQFRGQMIGGAARGIASGVRSGVGMASAMVGGQGPMSALMGGIPFLGGAAALAEGAVGSFVERQHAQLGALPYVTMGATKAGASRGALTAAEAGGRAAYMKANGGDAAAAMREATAAQYAQWHRGGKSDKYPEGLSGESYEATYSSLRYGKATVDQLGDLTPAERAGIKAEAAEMVKRKNGLAAKNADAAGKAARSKVAAAAQAAATPFGQMQAATHGLLTGTEAIQAGTQFTKQVGGRYNDQQFAQGFAAQTLKGVDLDTSAQLFRQQRAGRGGTSGDQTNMLAKTMAQATAQGLDGSEVNEYLGKIASMQADAESKGMKIDTGTLSDLSTAMSQGLGLEGPQAMRIAGNVTSAAQNMVTNGAKGPMDVQMLRASGFDPSKGNFLETRRKMAGGMDASSTFDLLQNLVGGEGDELKRGYTLERSGLGLGTEQAIKVQDMLKRGKDAFMSSVGNKKGSAEELLSGMAMTDAKGNPTTLGSMTGGIRGQNAVANTLVGAGGAAAGNVQSLQQSAATLATSMAKDLKPAMDVVTKEIKLLSTGIGELVHAITNWKMPGL
jgi:hypothetical protein